LGQCSSTSRDPSSVANRRAAPSVPTRKPPRILGAASRVQHDPRGRDLRGPEWRRLIDRSQEARAGRWTGRRRTRSPAPMRVLTGRGRVRFLASRGRWSSRGAIPHGKGGGARERPVWQPGPARAGPHVLGRIVVPGGLGRPLRRQSGRRRRARDEERVVAGDRAARLRPTGTSSAAAIACADPGSVTRTTKMPPTLRPDASVAPGLRAEPAAALIGRHWPGTEGPCQ